MGRRVHQSTDDRHRPRDEGPADRPAQPRRQARDSGRSAWHPPQASDRRETLPATMLMVGCRETPPLDRRHRADSAFASDVSAEAARTGDEAIGRMRLGAIDLLVVGETDLPDQPLRRFVQKVTSAWPGLSWAMWRSAQEPTHVAADELWARQNGATAVVDGEQGWGQLVELTERCSAVRRSAQRSRERCDERVVPIFRVPSA